MPTIPTALSTRSIPESVGSPMGNTAPLMPTGDPVGAAFQQGGAQFEQSANKVQHLLGIQEHLQKSNKAEKLSFSIEDSANQIVDAMKTNPQMDAEMVQKALDGVIDRHKQEYNDPDVWTLADKKLMHISNSLMSTARVNDTNKLIDEAKANTDRIIYDGVRAAAAATTPQERMAIKGEMVGNVLGKVNAGVFTQEQGQLIINHLDEQIAVEHVMQVGLTDAGKALSLLNDKSKEGEAYAINPIKRDEMIKHFEGAAKSQKVTGLLVDIETRNANPQDPVAGLVSALNEAESTEFLKANGVEVQSAVMANITNKLRRQQQEIVIKDNNLASTLNKKMVENNLSYNDIVNSGMSAAGQGTMFRNLRSFQSEQRAEARANVSLGIAARQESRINKQLKSDEIYGQLLSDIVTGAETNPLHIISKQTEGLLPTDANRLINDLTKIQNNPDLKAAYKIIDTKYLKVDPVNASILKKDIYMANVKDGITGDALIKRANEAIGAGKDGIVKSFFKNYWSSYQDSITDTLDTGKAIQKTRTIVEQRKTKTGRTLTRYSDGSIE